MALKVADMRQLVLIGEVIQLAVSLGVVVVCGVDEGYQFPEMKLHHRCSPHQLLAVMFCGYVWVIATVI